jgi:hypothetical protein
MKFSMALVAAAAATMLGSAAYAAVSADEAKQLGTTLTAIGAEKAGNADGSIPEYTGGLTTPPATYQKGSGIRPDPFVSEKPVYTVTAKNMAQYEAKLTPTARELLKRHPEMRIDVFPTHRTMAFPKFIHEFTLKNATSAKSTDGGSGVIDNYVGFPFPIPKSGAEAMWNHLHKYVGRAYRYKNEAYNIDSSGKASLATSGEIWQDFPYYDGKHTSKFEGNEIFFRSRLNWFAPARRAGEMLISLDAINPMAQGRRAYIYLPGQRRVKLAPEVGYDTPNPGTAGMTTYDEGIMFNGALDRYDFKLAGKKEMLVPYNTYRALYEKNTDALTTPGFMNPDYIRWENHRVWVVEATLKSGKRHIYPKRTFYLDEDSWAVVATDCYDARNQLFRGSFGFPTPAYETTAASFDMQVNYDFNANAYAIVGIGAAKYGGIKYTEPEEDRFYSPEALTAAGIR